MTIPKVSEEEKMIARFLEERFGGRPKFFIHRDSEQDPEYIAIAKKADFPDAGMVTLATNGISNQPLYDENGNEYKDTRLEIIGSCLAEQSEIFEEMIYFAAAQVSKNKWFCAPGTFLKGGVSRFSGEGDMEHLYFTSPFAFDGFDTTVFGDRKVSWLSAMPVSTAEMEYALQNSTSMLEDAFEENDIDWFDLKRASLF